MKLCDILLERISDVVFRTVSPKIAVRNLSKNQFQLSPAFSPDQIDFTFQKGRLFYLSTFRSLGTGWIKYKGGSNSIVLYVLDGRKLSQNYKGVPANYFTSAEVNISDREAEDRVVSNKAVIPNAVKYIKEIHVSVLPNDTYQAKDIKTLESLANNANIPIYFYTDNKNFQVLNKKKASKTYNPDFSDVRDEKLGNEDKIPVNTILYQLIQIYKNPKYKELDGYFEANIDAIGHKENSSYEIKEMLNDLSAEGYSSRHNKYYVDVLYDELYRFMRKERTKKIDEFIKLVAIRRAKAI